MSFEWGNNWEHLGNATGGSPITESICTLVGEYTPILEYATNGFSYDQKWHQYGTLYSWSQHYGIPHTSFLRSLEWKEMKTFTGLDDSGRETSLLYCEKDIVSTCVVLYHQAKLPILDINHMCTIDGADFITRQGFVLKFPWVTWARAGRVASVIEKNWGMKMAKFRPSVGVPQFLKVYRLTALKNLLAVDMPLPEKIVSLEWEIGERIGTIPLWASYLYVSTEWLRWFLKGVPPSKKVIVANGRTQDAYGEDLILETMQMVASKSKSNLAINSLEDWRLLPAAWETNKNWEIIPEVDRNDSLELIDTTGSWAHEFSTTDGAIEQLIKRRNAHENGVFGRSWIRLVRLYTRQFITDILANKKPWGTNRKKKRRKATAD